MGKWIADGSVFCREIHGSLVEGHNTLSGNPTFKVRLGVSTSNYKEALAKLLGNPEPWPHETQFQNVVAVAADKVANVGQYTTDADNQILLPANETLIDMTYMPRNGIYTESYISTDVYVDDIIEPRIESRPVDNRTLIWGDTDPVTVPTDHIILNPDQTPSKYEPGEQLTHIIEGFDDSIQLVGAHIGTCNAEDYTSAPLNGRVFEAGTLLLRNLYVTKSMTFRSYRLDSGLPTYTIKCIYEYKSIGWQRFYRIDPIGNANGYYYIRYNTTPYGLYQAFPIVTHQNFLF